MEQAFFDVVDILAQKDGGIGSHIPVRRYLRLHRELNKDGRDMRPYVIIALQQLALGKPKEAEETALAAARRRLAPEYRRLVGDVLLDRLRGLPRWRRVLDSSAE